MLISCTYCCFKVANVVRGNTREKAMVFSSSLNLPCEISGPFFDPSTEGHSFYLKQAMPRQNWVLGIGH